MFYKLKMYLYTKNKLGQIKDKNGMVTDLDLGLSLNFLGTFVAEWLKLLAS